MPYVRRNSWLRDRSFSIVERRKKPRPGGSPAGARAGISLSRQRNLSEKASAEEAKGCFACLLAYLAREIGFPDFCRAALCFAGGAAVVAA